MGKNVDCDFEVVYLIFYLDLSKLFNDFNVKYSLIASRIPNYKLKRLIVNYNPLNVTGFSKIEKNDDLKRKIKCSKIAIIPGSIAAAAPRYIFYIDFSCY